MQDTVRLRSKVAMAARTYLDTLHGNQWAIMLLHLNVLIKCLGFVDIETPTLFKRTPEVKYVII